jgi:hypothetical protein
MTYFLELFPQIGLEKVLNCRNARYGTVLAAAKESGFLCLTIRTEGDS